TAARCCTCGSGRHERARGGSAGGRRAGRRRGDARRRPARAGAGARLRLLPRGLAGEPQRERQPAVAAPARGEPARLVRRGAVRLHRRRQLDGLRATADGLRAGLRPRRLPGALPRGPGRPGVVAADVDELHTGGNDKPPATSTPGARRRARLRANYEGLAAPERAAALQRTLTELWACLEPDWQREGRSATAQAAERLVD